MDRPDTQVIGVLAEDEVKTLFMRWGWNPGIHRIDRGYDLFVTPGEPFKDRSFFVQVKGTARETLGVVSAPASKKRLRQYAEASHPVVLVRAINNDFYWLDAQQWCATHQELLSGIGDRSIQFDRGQLLADRERFEEFLHRAFLATATRQIEDTAGLGHLSETLTNLLARASSETPAPSLQRVEEPALQDLTRELRVSFRAGEGPENQTRLREAIALGLPRTVDVKDLHLTGQSVYGNKVGPLAGQLTLTPLNAEPLNLLLYPGAKPSITALALPLPAERFKGLQHGAVSNERLKSLLNFSMLPGKQYPTCSDIDISFGLRSNVLTGRPLRQFHELSSLPAWAEQMLSHREAHLEIQAEDGHGMLALPAAFVDHFEGVIRLAWALGRLHAVTRVLQSEFSLPDDFELTERDLDDISFAFRLLRGDQLSITPGPIEVEPRVDIDYSKQFEMLITTNFVVAIAGQEVGGIPAIVELLSFNIVPIPGTNRLRLEGGPEGRALVYYDEHDDKESLMRRAGQTTS
ncbi:hypothetical protein [Stenotrophomonas sp. YIM B13575]|uniref:hypothetical protein n=1 Tax=Stenotrophomonas sp. YIM B13575 TaxID=3366314 RepID=UPI0036A6DB5C